MPDDKNSNRRLDFRQDDMISMKVERLSQEEWDAGMHRSGTHLQQNVLLQRLVDSEVFPEGSSSHVNPEIAKALEVLEAKLNYLIGLNVQHDSNRGELEERLVNMSISGMSFTADEQYHIDDRLRLTLSFPLFPPSVLELLARVAHAKSLPHNQTLVGAKFNYRCEDEEEAVTRYIFKRQREKIRFKSCQKNDQEHRLSRLDDHELMK